jgi:hypothetical protein
MITGARMTINTWKGPQISAVLKYVQHLFFNPLIAEHFSVHRPIITGRNIQILPNIYKKQQKVYNLPLTTQTSLEAEISSV